MNSNCDKMKDQIADLITGILPKTETDTLQQHLSECSACRDYARALRKEDELLTGLFAKFDASMAGWEDEAINTINDLDASGQTNIIAVGRTIMRSLLAKHAAAAAVIVVAALYFIITLAWISQINDCIRLCL